MTTSTGFASLTNSARVTGQVDLAMRYLSSLENDGVSDLLMPMSHTKY